MLHTLWLHDSVSDAVRRDREERIAKRGEAPRVLTPKELKDITKSHGVKAANKAARVRARQVRKWNSPRALTVSMIVNEILSRHYKLDGGKRGKQRT